MFLERVLSLIDRKGISKNKMLTDLKLNKNSFVDWDKRGNTPKGEVLSKIAEYFGVSVDYLLGNTDSPDNTFVYDEDDNLVVIDDDTRELIDSLRTRPEMKILFSVSRKATKEDIEQAVKIIEALRKNENED